MAWQKVTKRQANFTRRPADWGKHPCVSIAKTQLSLNPLFMEAFGLRVGDSLDIYIDADRFKIGMKKHDGTTDSPGDMPTGYKISGPRNRGNGTPNQQARYISIRAIAHAFPDRIHRCFRASLNPGERIIECDLTEHLRFDTPGG